ncbi:MAG: type II toxin-antitoxin system PemK/MazF family toxin [Dehalococcoidia bacterium]
MVDQPYVPDRGHVVWLDFDPQVGHEQAGRRPAVVLSVRRFNRFTNLALVTPLTRQRKGFNFEVPLPDGLEVSGVALADHTTSVDWRGRRAEFIATLPADVVAAVINRVQAILD